MKAAYRLNERKPYMPGSASLLKYEAKESVKLCCKIYLDKLLQTQTERRNFDEKWASFIASDKTNKKIFKLRKDTLEYESEQFIPIKTDKRPPLLLVLGNPASHSVKEGMFFSFEGNKKEHRFWNRILKPAGVLNLSHDSDLPVKKLNEQRKKQLLALDYDSPFRIGLCVFISMPSAPGGKWGGVAGVQKLIGIRALRLLEIEETKRIQKCVKKFIGSTGKVVVFQKNAWNALRSSKNLEYKLALAKAGKLKGKLKEMADILLLGVPPTRLAGSCSKVLRQLLEE